MIDDFDHIGSVLKAARKTAGLSLDDVHFRTRLPQAVLSALEAGNFSEFSSPVYARSFLSQYSGYLNVDAYPWIEALQSGGFTAEGALVPVLDSSKSSAAAKAVPAGGHGGWSSVLALLALSTALVIATVKGYEFFESRFAVEKTPLREKASAAPADVSKRRSSKKISIRKEDEELAEAPPRAIIVR